MKIGDKIRIKDLERMPKEKRMHGCDLIVSGLSGKEATIKEIAVDGTVGIYESTLYFPLRLIEEVDQLTFDFY